jgi:hypothetical protein
LLCTLWRWQRHRRRRRQQHFWSGFVAALLDGGGDSSSTQIVVAAYSLGASSSRASTPTSLEYCHTCLGILSQCGSTCNCGSVFALCGSTFRVCEYSHIVGVLPH